ncbi:PfkB family carbohydrate kinase [Martelella sp. HB161492]|uniref:carbohydrate kinase family protein n=1 Tax=Martelella sp. HB161492 TaxID=2720726 RepID=UPI00159090FF|nr:PfkB family carbohydrate kinase [Martelella sp. HB161492]
MELKLPSDPDRPHEVLLVGEYYYDLIFSGLRSPPTLGSDIWSDGFEAVAGANFTTARAFRLLNIKAGWWCEAGSDIFSQLMLAEAARLGIDTSLVQRRAEPRIRVSAAFSMPEDRGFISHFAGEETLPSRQHIDRLRPRVLLVQGLTCRDGLADLFAHARSLGVLCCLDCQHVDEGLQDKGLTEILSHLDVFFLNETEAARLTGLADCREALAALSAHVPAVILKRGAKGAIARVNGAEMEQAALPVTVVDTTGAGDSFNAGFVYGLLKGWSLSNVLGAAVACGSAAVTAHGGHGLPGESDLLNALNETSD